MKTATDKTYDGQGNVLTETLAAGFPEEVTITRSYTASNRVETITRPSVVNPAQNTVITNTYNAQDLLQTRTETGLLADSTPYSDVTTYGYDANGRRTSIDGPRTDVIDITQYGYDNQGRLTQLIQPGGQTTTYSNFTTAGQPQTLTDANGLVISLTYDENQRVLTRTVGTDQTVFTYTPTGKVATVTRPGGGTMTYSYDALDRLTSISDSAGNARVTTYDSAGNRLREDIQDNTSTTLRTTSYTYDALNRLSKTLHPDAAQSFTLTAYDALGNRTAVTDPNGNTTQYTNDARGRNTRMIQPGSLETVYAYDSQGNLTTVTDANGNATTYTIDDRGHRALRNSPDSGITQYSYDPAGNLTTETDARGITLSYTYDARNRPLQVTSPNEAPITYTYDTCTNGQGRLCTITDASGSMDYSYSLKGEVTVVTKVIDGIPYTTGYGYNNDGLLTRITYPGGRVVNYTINPLNQITALSTTVNSTTTTIANNIRYQPFGPMTALTYGNGLVRTLSHDPQYRLVTLRTGGVQDLSYGYDANGNITGQTDNLDGSQTKGYGYDALNRLDSATGPWGNLGWSYDGVGNRQTQTDTAGTSTYGYTPGGNRLDNITTGAQTIQYTRDAHGNRTGDGTLTYTYDDRNRLRQVEQGATVLATYSYNPQNQRIKKTAAGQTTVYHYTLSGQLIAESLTDGTIIKEYAHLRGEPLIQWQGNQSYYIHTDHLGTPRLMTDTTGAKVWEISTRPFGEDATITGSAALNLRFPGQYYDKESKLYYNWNRYYDSKAGRYVTSDPIGLAGGLNTYAYVVNNPKRFIDLFGLAYFAKRPLGGWPWMGPLSCNPIDDFFDTEISHEQLFFEDGKSPSNVGFFDSGQLETEPNPAGYRCKSGKYNDCIMRKAHEKTPALPSYCLIGQNCQTWAARVRAEYERLAQNPQVQKECEECKQ